jgi:hypothetical protein
MLTGLSTGVDGQVFPSNGEGFFLSVGHFLPIVSYCMLTGLSNGSDGQAFPPDGEQFFPEVGRGELGACAVVAVADNLLGKKRGPEIDAHDTVIRYNGPMKAYTRDVGSKVTQTNTM